MQNFPVKQRTDYIILYLDYFCFGLLGRILYGELMFGKDTSYCVLDFFDLKKIGGQFQ